MTLPPLPGSTDPLVLEITHAAVELHLAQRSRELDRTPAFPRAEYRELGRRRLLGLHTPIARGGRGVDLPGVGRALFHLGRVSGTAFAKLTLQPEFSSVLAEHGTPELVERFYRPMVRGELLVANQVTEPGAGSDAGALAMTARREGDSYRLDGSKSEAAFAVDADAAIVYARTGPAGSGAPGVSAFLVPQDLEGISRSMVGDLGERWMRRGRVEYGSVLVPVGHRIGEEGAAFGYLQAELVRERALLAAIYLGVARASWEETVAHVGERTAFGRPLSSQEAVGFPLVEDWARLDAAWEFVDRTLHRLARGEPVSAEASMSKWLATETALSAIDHAIQFHGGAGYSQALPHEQRWRDVRSGGIAHGTHEIMHLVAARSLWSKGR
ncbi:MAG: acyl-CoA/acyl-ACP dehydrogenase [Thermoplasmata archaeon]|nr:acyl-CoA/acyl-ACP dehydrogenase [Thermoplasmata archaeon]